MTRRRWSIGWAPQHRAQLTPDAIRAGYGQHRDSGHGGQVGRACRTCARYLAAISAAAEREQAST